MDETGIAVIAGFVVLYSLVSARLPRTILTGPILFVAFGLVVGPELLDVVNLDVGDETFRLFAELTLVLVLFVDASRINLRTLRHNVGVPVRLLGIGMPLTVAAGVGIGWLIFADLDFWALGLVAVMLAPTDAALGQAVVENRRVPIRIRQALNVESGLNDGIAVPVIALFTAGAASAATSSGGYDFWVEFAAKAIGYGLLVGVGGGLFISYASNLASRAGWTNDSFRRIAMLGVPLCVFTISESVGGSGFLSAFVAGLAVASITDTSRHGLLDFADETSVLLGLITWVLFGGAFVGQTLTDITWEPVVYALLSLTVVRIIPVSLSLIGSGFRWETYAFLGWFGPRGLASIVFIVGLLEVDQIEHLPVIAETVVWTVLLSVLLHGATSSFAARRYGAACARMPDDTDAAEMVDVAEMPHRRAFHIGRHRPGPSGSSPDV